MKRSAVVVAFLVLAVLFPQTLDLSFYADYLFGGFSYLSSLFYSETTTPERLKSDYVTRKIRVLLVPGHDNERWGTEYKGVKEADLNLALGRNLERLLNGDERFQVGMTRWSDGEYAPWFRDYIAVNEKQIGAFQDERRVQFAQAIKDGFVSREAQVVHNDAPLRVARDLYAINKYAKDNAVDLVVHIHWNDYPGRRKDKEGKYSGFAIYVPEDQLPNARASKAIGEAIQLRLSAYFAKSNYPKEASAIVPDQDLIAIGANASQEKAAILIEYGYIYEEQFTDPKVREVLLSELALQTYWGLVDFFEQRSNVADRRLGALLPYRWDTILSPAKESSRGTLALQAALLEEGFYPPKEKTLNDCPLSGTYGDCTRRAVKAFQEKFAEALLAPLGLSQPTGIAGEYTLALLTKLHGSPAN